MIPLTEDRSMKDEIFDHLCTLILGTDFDHFKMKEDVITFTYLRIKTHSCVKDIDRPVYIETVNLLIDFGGNGCQVTHIDTHDGLLQESLNLVDESIPTQVVYPRTTDLSLEEF
jgi:hypothetical protein